MSSVIVLAKRPEPGRVKTRLVPPLTHVQAAELAAAALRDTLRSAEKYQARRRILAFDGAPDGWLPTGWGLHRQRDGGLDVRLTAALLAAGPGPALLVGMDTPQLHPDQLAAFEPQHYDACLGPASDGGYWAIGLRDPRRAVEIVPGVAMSTAATAGQQLRRMAAAGMRIQLLDELSDVDTADVAVDVAEAAPHTEFARVAAELFPAAVR